MTDCTRCDKKDLEDYLYVKNPTSTDPYGRSDYLCEPCALELWPCNVQFLFNYGVPDEVRKHFRRFEMLERLRQWNVPHKFVPVHFFHRRETESTRWMNEWDHRSMYSKPSEPYGYRAWCSGSEIIMLVDETETCESLEWVFLHELSHAVCNQTRMYDYAMDRENKTEGRKSYEWRDDEGHEADSEERLVNRIATAWMDGQERARPWWRPRVIARERGYTVFPDAFAPVDSPELEVFRFAVAEGWTAKRKDGTMLPIHGYDYDRGAHPALDPAAFPEDVRRSEDFRKRLEEALNPPATKVAIVTPATSEVREESIPSKATWSE